MKTSRWAVPWLLFAALAVPPGVATARERVGYLSPPRAGDALDVALGYLRERPEASRGELDEFGVVDRVRNRRTGVTQVVLQQRIGGIAVRAGSYSVHVAPDGRILAVHGGFAARTARPQARSLAPRISAEEAVTRAARELGLPPPRLVLRARERGPARAAEFAGGALSRDPIRAELVYVREEADALRLVWSFTLRLAREAWQVDVDAESGAITHWVDRMQHDAYRVFALPTASPLEGDRSFVVDPADALASPFGWHDTNGVTGADTTSTTGSNAQAQDDADANDSGGSRPSNGSRVFDLPFDPLLEPEVSRSAAIVNAFYWVSLLHDLHYRYGFDEPAGNMQTSNYGRGGQSGDPVIVDVQDGAGTNDAQIFVPPDGGSPRMELFLWRNPRAVLDVLTPAAVAGPIEARGAEFGPPLTASGVQGTIVAALDAANAAGPSTTDGCTAFANAAAVSGKLALIDRGTCLFVTKIANAEAAGARGAVIVNHTPNELIVMAGDDPSIEIPSLFIRLEDGARLRAAASPTGTLRSNGPGRLDSGFDGSVLIHEYGHAISERRTGGPATIECLDAVQSDGMAEGWSDFWAIALTARSSDAPADPREIAAYLSGDPGGRGIRSFPYSTDLARSPLTFAAIAGLDVPHGVGEVWAAALWELHWNLVQTYGFNPDLLAGQGGNSRALELVMDALSLQPCNPSFLDGRDALLAADLASSGGANACAIWRAFAKRGMGVGAAATATSLAVTESFDLPLECPEPSGAAAALVALTALAALARRRLPDPSIRGPDPIH